MQPMRRWAGKGLACNIHSDDEGESRRPTREQAFIDLERAPVESITDRDRRIITLLYLRTRARRCGSDEPSRIADMGICLELSCLHLYSGVLRSAFTTKPQKTATKQLLTSVRLRPRAGSQHISSVTVRSGDG
eukprot:1659411-Prymnesium_polylepis.1